MAGMRAETVEERGIRRTRGALAAAIVLILAACGADPGTGEAQDPDPAREAAADRDLAPEQEVFWNAFQEHCGNAYAGRVSDVTPYYADGVEGAKLTMHVMTCEEDRLHIPFHIDENRSRNWILTKVDGTIRLKHDHRNPDGSEEEISQYGGDAPPPGLPTRQIFPADEHTARILPDRADNFWFFDFVDARTLQYGVHWPKFGHSIRVEFDLSTPVEPPPRPWGYEDG